MKLSAFDGLIVEIERNRSESRWQHPLVTDLHAFKVKAFDRLSLKPDFTHCHCYFSLPAQLDQLQYLIGEFAIFHLWICS